MSKTMVDHPKSLGAVALTVVRVVVLPESGPFDELVALGHYLVREVGVAVAP